MIYYCLLLLMVSHAHAMIQTLEIVIDKVTIEHDAGNFKQLIENRDIKGLQELHNNIKVIYPHNERVNFFEIIKKDPAADANINTIIEDIDQLYDTYKNHKNFSPKACGISACVTLVGATALMGKYFFCPSAGYDTNGYGILERTLLLSFLSTVGHGAFWFFKPDKQKKLLEHKLTLDNLRKYLGSGKNE